MLSYCLVTASAKATICDGGDAGKPVALNADSITGTAFRQLADEVVKAVEENHDPAKRVRVTRQ